MRPTWPAPVARSADVAWLILLVVVVVVALIAVILVRRNRAADSSVDSFRRHIDALGPEARRTTVDQVQSAAARNAGDEAADRNDDGDPTEPQPPATDDGAGEDGGRGT